MLPIIFISNNAAAQSENIATKPFDKVIVSPHIKVIFRQGETESVSVEDIEVPMNKLNIEVKNKTLRVYLEGAKMFSKSKKTEDWESKSPLYRGTVARIVVTYKEVTEFSLRGEEKMLFESPIKTEDLQLTIYGESQITINELVVNDLKVTMYGENEIEIKKGSTQKQKFTSYGENHVNTLELENQATKVVVYGDAFLRLTALDRLKVTSYGEAKVMYRGNPAVSRGVTIGETTIRKIR